MSSSASKIDIKSGPVSDYEHIYKQQLGKAIPGCDVKQSQLYTDKRPLKRI